MHLFQTECLLIAMIVFVLMDDIFQVACLLIAMLLFGLRKNFNPGDVSTYCNVIVRSQE